MSEVAMLRLHGQQRMFHQPEREAGLFRVVHEITQQLIDSKAINFRKTNWSGRHHHPGDENSPSSL